MAMVIDQMNPDLYKAVVKGNVEDYHEALGQMPVEARRRQVTPKGNTVLHVAAIHGHKDLVEEILKEVKKDDAAMSLLFAKNKKNESALHCAAEKGYDGVVSVILSAIKKHEDEESAGGRVREMIEMMDDVKDTALHKAVRMGHLEVAKLLIQENPEFEYLANDDGETPIYIAAELQFHGCLKEMLDKCQKPTYGGPLGRNALHATILSGFGYTESSGGEFVTKSTQLLKNTSQLLMNATKGFGYTKSSGGEFVTECTQLLLEKNISLYEETDKSGWTPLHYAIKIENHKAAHMIFERNPSAVYIFAGGSNEWTTTLHIAVKHGKVKMMKEISNRFPDCWEMLNSKRQNALHEAILNDQFEVIYHIKLYHQFDNLCHQKDKDGNTPLYLLAVTHRSDRNGIILDKDKKTLLKSIKFADDRVRKFLKHENNILGEEEKDKIEGMIETGKTSIVVATLILTMTFAACIAVPGGYNQEKGYPIFLRNTAFKAFIVTNTIAFLCSFCSIALHIAMVSEASRYSRSLETVLELSYWQHVMLAYSCYGVVIAFPCAMYVTLAPLRVFAIVDLTIGIYIGGNVVILYNLLFLGKKQS